MSQLTASDLIKELIKVPGSTPIAVYVSRDGDGDMNCVQIVAINQDGNLGGKMPETNKFISTLSYADSQTFSDAKWDALLDAADLDGDYTETIYQFTKDIMDSDVAAQITKF